MTKLGEQTSAWSASDLLSAAEAVCCRRASSSCMRGRGVNLCIRSAHGMFISSAVDDVMDPKEQTCVSPAGRRSCQSDYSTREKIHGILAVRCSRLYLCTAMVF